MLRIKWRINTIKQEKLIAKNSARFVDLFKRNNIIYNLPTRAIDSEYCRKEYLNFKKWLLPKWQKGERDFLKKIAYFFNLKDNRPFIINITNYGPLGFYDYDAKNIFINKNSKLDIVKTIKHEIVHVMLQKYIDKFKIPHIQKEEMVNKLLEIIDGSLR